MQNNKYIAEWIYDRKTFLISFCSYCSDKFTPLKLIAQNGLDFNGNVKPKGKIWTCCWLQESYNFPFWSTFQSKVLKKQKPGDVNSVQYDAFKPLI